MKRQIILVLAAMLAAGCTSSDATTSTTEPIDTRTPSQVALALLKAVAMQDTETAAALTVTDQSAVVAVIEGTSVNAAAGLVGSKKVIENFWLGFLELSGVGILLAAVSRVTEFTAEDVEFARVSLRIPPSTEDSHLVVRRTPEGWRVDLLTSFMITFSGRLAGAAQEATKGSPAVHEEFLSNIPSMEAALTNPDLTGASQQAILLTETVLGVSISD